MRMSRSERTAQTRGRRRTVAYTVLGALAVLLLGAGVVWAVTGFGRAAVREAEAASTVPDLQLAAIETNEPLEPAGRETTATSQTQIEVPDVTGKPIAEAEVLLAAAGLSVERRDTAQAVASEAQVVVVSQDPEAGTVVAAGTVVLLRVPATARAATAAAEQYIVCIDPGHQAKSDLRAEPIGPDATETKGRVLGGTTGASTRIPEYEVVLQIATNLKARLEAAGVKVVMTRTTNDVNISNSERAKVANEAGADLFIRIHCDGSTDSATTGISTLYPESNAWTARIAGPSKLAAASVHSSVIAATGAVSRGTIARGDQTGFNWAQVPAITVECGFMTNPVEDKLLASPHYQDKLAEGMRNGIMAYLGEN